MKITVKAALRVIPPPPPEAAVDITMTPEEARLLRDSLRIVVDTSPIQHYPINWVLNALNELDLPSTAQP